MSALDNAISGIRWRLRATRRIWRPDATHGMPLLPTEPIPDGRIDEPAAGEDHSPRDHLDQGLGDVPDRALHTGRGPSRRPPARAGEAGRRRGSISARRLGPAAGLSGFELKEDLTAWPGDDGDVDIRCVAHGPGGERHELTTRVTVAPAREVYEPEHAEPPARAPKDGTGAVRTVFFTHQLTLGGAQLYLQDLLRELTASDLVDATVISTMDGPLRDELDELGIPST